MNVFSLCDGMSCGQISLKELGIEVDNYFASEIEPNAIKVTQENFPNTIQLGDLMNFIHSVENDVILLNEEELRKLPKIDLVMFGSPCRSLSKATLGRDDYNKGLQGVSGLFYMCNAILQWIKQYNNKDVFFLVENVDSNNKNDLSKMSKCLGVESVMIDSAIFSAQDRKRNYWTNIPLSELPQPSELVLADVLDDYVDEKFYYPQTFDFHGENIKVAATLHINGHDILKRVMSKNYKCHTLTACRG